MNGEEIEYESVIIDDYLPVQNEEE